MSPKRHKDFEKTDRACPNIGASTVFFVIRVLFIVELKNRGARMKTTNIGQVFTSGGVNGLYTTRPNLQSIRFSKGLAWTLRKLVEKREKSKYRGYVEVESAIMGAVRFDCTYRGAKRGWVHKLAFGDGQGLKYEEMRHGITLAIFALTGQYSALQVSFDLLSVEWRLVGGEKMFDHIGKQYEIVSGERGLIADLSRVVTRDIEPNKVV